MTVRADSTLLRILLDNLVENAIKYGGAGARIMVQLQRKNEVSVLSVRDNGSGVTLENRARLGDGFFRVMSHRGSGSGLGLSVVIRIATLFDARVTSGAGFDEQGFGVEVVFPACD